MMSKILICEDDEAVSKITKRLLATAGYEVTETANGSEALEVLYQPQKIDLLLTDLILPAPMSGLQLATRAKALSAELPIILMSGYSHNEATPSDRLCELTLLSKPFSRDELLRAVAAGLSASAQGRNTRNTFVPEADMSRRKTSR